MLRAEKVEKLQASYGESVTLIKGQETRHVVQNHPCRSRKRKLDIPEEIHPNISLDTKPHNNVDEPKVIASLTFDLTGSSYV